MVFGGRFSDIGAVGVLRACRNIGGMRLSRSRRSARGLEDWLAATLVQMMFCVMAFGGRFSDIGAVGVLRACRKIPGISPKIRKSAKLQAINLKLRYNSKYVCARVTLLPRVPV